MCIRDRAQAVQSDDFKQAKYKIVIAHMPPLPDKNLWHGQMEVLEKFVPILNQAGVDVMLSGHLHRYFNNKPTDKVKFPVIDNAHKTVIKAVACLLYTSSDDTPTAPAWEFYDLQKDPHENHNAYKDAEYAPVIKEMKARLLELRKEANDEDRNSEVMQEIIKKNF